MITGLALLFIALALRGVSLNRHVRGRLTASAVVAAVYLATMLALSRGQLSPAIRDQLLIIQPLLLAFAIINGVVALLLNPWRVDRLPDRFPTILQDSIVLGLFVVAATMLLQERIFAATAAGAVVIGLALQDTLGNLFAGLAIQTEKPFRVGHWVRIADVDGLVSQVTWRATKVRTKSGNFVIVPNSKVSSDMIINYSEPTLESRIEVEVGVTYDVAPNRVKAVILAAISDDPLILPSRTPEVLLADFAGSAMTYRIRVWTSDFAADERIRDSIRGAVYYALKREGIEIPYPIQVQYDRVESPAPKGLDEASAAVLRSVSLFRNLSEAEHAHLAAGCRLLLYGAGDAIVRQGGAGHSMFVVVKGEAVVLIEPDNKEVARIPAGGFFGEMSLLTGAPRNATVKAVVDSELVEIALDTFKQFVLANPSSVENIGMVVAERRAELEQKRAAGAAPAVEPAQSLVGRIRRFLGMAG